MADIKLTAEKRDSKGSNAVRKLRHENIVPAQLYQRDEDNLTLQVVEKELDKVVGEAGTSTIITLVVDGEEKNVLIKDYQRHPFKNQYLHVDFQGVNMNETLKISIPVTLVNRDDITLQPSVLIVQTEEIEIETLPKHIPDSLELDVKDMQYGDSFTVRDLDIVNDENITILTDLDELIAVLNEPQEEIIENDVEDVDPADVEVIGEEEAEESEE